MSAPRAWARLGLAAAAVVVGLTLSAAPASAHAVLIGSNPADGSSLDSAPSELVLTFDEAVTVESTVVHLLDESGRTLEVGAIAAGDGSGEEEAEAISAQLPQLPNGRYLIRWQTITSDDFHPVDGSLTFGVGTGVGVTAVGGTSERPVGDVLETLTRGTVVAGYMLAVGALALLLLAHPLLAARPIALRFVVRSCMVGVVGSVAGLALLAGLLTLDTGAAPPASFLLYWGAAAAGLLLLGINASTIDRLHGTRAPRPAAAATAVLAALATAWGLGHLGHGGAAAGSALSTVHVASTAVWAGGVALLVPLAFFAGRDGQSGWARDVIKRFGRLAVPALALSIMSGALLARGLVPTWGGLTETAYGQALLLKLLLIAVAVALGAITALRARRTSHDHGLGARLMTEASVVLGIVLLAAALSGGQPPNDARWRSDQDPTAITGVQTAPVDDLVVTLSVTPGTPGPNFATVQVLDTRRPSPAAITRVTLDVGDGPRAAEPAGNGTDWLLPETLEDTGAYDVQVRVQRSGWEDSVVSFPWQIAAASTLGDGGAPIGWAWTVLAVLAAVVALGVAVVAGRRGRSRGTRTEAASHEAADALR